MIELRKKRNLSKADLESNIDRYNNLKIAIDKKTSSLPRQNEEGIMQNVVCHIATKSESIDELDAELESESAVGVLKNTKISTDLSLVYPVCGKIVTEFGDKGQNGEMIYYISFETRPSAIVTSPAKGLVVFAGNFLNYGNMIIISNGEYRIFLYGMETMYTMTGDIVEIGDYVGKMKSSDDNIVKMELRKSGEALDPRHWLLQTLEKDGK
jgi:septal ring factor EnvC (AmiA/AmiB activator)